MRLPEILVPSNQPRDVEDDQVVRRRQLVVAATVALGSGLLAATLAAPEGSPWFYALGLLLAATWVVGSLLSGPMRLGRRRGVDGAGRQLLAPLLLGAGLFLGFAAAAFVAERLPLVGGAVDRVLDRVLDKADAGPRALVLAVAVANAVAEEVFFRGALHTAFGERLPAVRSTAVYTLVTLTTRNLALVAAAAVMGAVFAAEREATRGVLAPIVTHVTWSTLVLLLLPR